MRHCSIRRGYKGHGPQRIDVQYRMFLSWGHACTFQPELKPYAQVCWVVGARAVYITYATVDLYRTASNDRRSLCMIGDMS